MSNFSGLVRVNAGRIKKAVEKYNQLDDEAQMLWDQYAESLIGKNVTGWIFKEDDFDRLMSETCALTGDAICSDYGDEFEILDKQWYYQHEIGHLNIYMKSKEEEIYLNSAELRTLLWMEGL